MNIFLFSVRREDVRLINNLPPHMHTELQRAQEFQTVVESYQEIGKLWNKIECNAQNKGLNPGDGNFGHHEAVTWSNRDAKFQHSRYEPGDEDQSLVG